jgi:tryptophan halogenase
MPALAGLCDATYKLGVRFEGWGRHREVFFHNFAAGSYALHLSADRLPQLLARRIRATRLDDRVRGLRSDGRGVELDLASGATLQADFVFDARGFPWAELEDQHRLPGIPTDGALLRRGPVSGLTGGTRAVARPHGWIFVIPLAHRTSYGYIHRRELAALEEVAADFDRFLREEELTTEGDERLLPFPNFRRRSFFDGALFRLGNAAAFLEPLEATAIGLILHQLEVATLWLRDELVGVEGEARWSLPVLLEVNRELTETVDAVALFVAWHYRAGSIYDSPFWSLAQAEAQQALTAAEGTPVGDRFERLLRAAGEIPRRAVEKIRDPETFRRSILPHLESAPGGGRGFGGFDAASFAQVGYGLGLLEEPE